MLIGKGRFRFAEPALQMRPRLRRRRQPFPRPADEAEPQGFGATFEKALQSVNESQNKASALSEQYERGATVDIAKVMLARQEASVGFEATLQVRNKLLAAYKDIMSMPV